MTTFALLERDASHAESNGDNGGVHAKLRAEPAAGESVARSSYELVWFWRNERQSFVCEVATVKLVGTTNALS